MKGLLKRAKVRAIIGLLCLFGIQMLAAPASAAGFRFTITSDPRGGSDAVQEGLFFDRTLKAINSTVNGPGAFHVSLGDMDYAATNPSTRGLLTDNFDDTICYLLPGNHDRETLADMQWLRDEYTDGHDGRSPLKYHTNQNGPAGSAETTYSWDYANAHFIVLNIYWDGGTAAGSYYGTDGDIVPNLYDWLVADLATTNKPFIFVFIHEPAFPYNHHYGESLDKYPTNRNKFWSLLESEKVSAVFAGHCHYYFKHRGDVRGHTYTYPAHDSWRTQDPNVDGKYGNVWQICEGHAGWEPGGVEAGPTPPGTDNLPTSLQWNGLTFVDVNVTEDFAYINTYRDIRNINTNPDAGLNFELFDTVAINGDFLAYNDCVYDPGLVGYGTDPCGNSVHYGDPCHITVFGIGTEDTSQQPPGVGYAASSGELKDYTTGAPTGVIATLTQNGNPIWQPQVASTWTGGYDAAPSTDAYNTFHGIADMTGTIYYGPAAGWWVDVNFTGLDPNKTYTFATSASRAKDRTDGPANGYSDRWSLYTLSGITSATNASTPGTTEYQGNPLRIRFNTGNNHYEGYVARWTGISPGADGSFKVRAEAAPDANAGYKAYAFDVFMLREEPMVPDNDPPTPNPMTWASLPAATSSSTITMTATTATDPNNLYPPVQYYFECTTDSNKSSGWQISPTYVAASLTAGTQYTFRVKARDSAPINNETGLSVNASAVTSPAPVMPTFVAAGAITSNALAITPALPAGIATGDILLLFLETSNQAITIPTPNGGTWTAVTNSPQSTGTSAGATGARLTVFWSRYNGTQGAPTTSDSGDHQMGLIAAFRGVVASGNPWDVTAGGVEAVADTTGSIPGATTTIINDLIVAAIAAALPDSDITTNFSAWANTNLTSVTERTDNTTSQGNGGGLGIATGGRAATGAYGSTTVTLGTAAYKGMMSIALKPAPGSGTPPGLASSPSPATGATGVSTTTTLSWTAGSGAVVHDVYFGTDSTPDETEFKGSQAGTTYNPGTLLNNTTYYWRIDEKNNGGTTTGTVWNFATVSAGGPYTISGNAGTSGAVMGGLPGNPVSDSNGNYTGTVTSGWSGTVTPAKTGFTFSPVNRVYTNVTSNQTAQNYTATQITFTITGNAGTGTVTMNGLPGNPVSDSNGNYTGTVNYGFSATVTPAKAGYTFSPVSRVYTNVTSNQTAQNYTATINTYTISGNTTVADVNLVGLGVVSDGSGNYTKTVNYGFSATVTPAKAGYTFSPVSRTYTNVTSNQTAQNYTATINTYTISGNTTVADVNLVGLGVVSDGSGNYTKTVNYGFSATVTPAKAGYTFSPVSRTYTNVTSNQTAQDYTATQITFTITGNAGTGTVTMNGLPGNPVSDSNGNYTGTVNYGFSGTVTPAKTGFTFSPVNRVYTNVTSNQTAQDYTATINTYTISGNTTVADVNLVGLGVVSDGSGNYTKTVNYGFSATVTPAKAGYTFSPVSRVYTNVTSNQTAQDYTATQITFTITGNAGTGTVTMNGLPGNPVSDSNGNYTGTVNYGFSGTVTPAKTGFTFSPVNRVYTNVTSNQTAQDYTATINTYTISGNTTVADVNLVGLGVVSDGSGNYTKTVNYGFSATVTPAKAGYTFSPVSRTYTNVTSNQTAQDYTATQITFTITGNAGTGTVTMNGLPGNPVSDSNGNYTGTVNYGFSATVTPAKAGYTFSPVSRTYTNVTSNQTAQDYTATINTYTISGNTTVADVNLVGLGVVSDGSGNYTKTVNYGFSATVTPAKAGYTFSPVSRTYTNVTSNQTAQDYTATINTYTISGNTTVADVNLVGLGVVSDGSGNYTKTVNYGFSATVTPAKAGYTFSPVNRVYTNVTSNQTAQNYTATINTYTISGNTTVADVNLVGLGVVSDGSGNYTKTVNYGFSATVTPAKAGYTFSPVNRVYTNVTSNQTAQNYTATINTYTISGNTTVADVNLVGLGVVSDGSGNYTKTVNYGFSATVTPAKAGYTFSPVSRTYTNVTSNQTAQDYTATINTYTISGNTTVADVNLVGLGVVSDGSGNYTKTVNYGFSATVTPAKAGYTFSPVNRVYTNVTSNQTAQNYTATINTYTISGNTTVADVNLVGLGVVSDGSGNYTKTVNYGFSATVTPAKAGYTFSPVSRTYTNVTSNQTAQDYTATQITFTITGNAGTGTVTMNGLPGNPVSDSNGNYTGTVNYGFSGTVTPAKTGFTFSPVNRVYTNVTSNQTAQDYTATINTYTISGNTTVADVNLVGLGVVSDGSGNYTKTVNYGFSATVTPAKAGYTFSPVSRVYTNVTSNQTAQDYTATINTYTISGNTTVADVNLVGLGVVSDGSGNYTKTVNYGFSGTVTPAKAGYTFSPVSRTYTNVTSNQTAQDYTATPSTTYIISGRATVSGLMDLAAPCVGYWKMNDNAANTTVIDSSGKGNNGTAQQNTSVLHTDSGNPPNLNGALTFNGTSDYVNIGNAIGTGAYTKVAWVKRTGGVQNNIISSSTWSHVLWAPSEQSFKLSAGHNSSLFLVQDSVAMQTNTWYFVAVTFDPNVASGRMVLYKNGTKVDDANNVPTQIAGTTYIGRFLTGYGFTGSIDNVLIFNRTLSQEEISYLYNSGNGTEAISQPNGLAGVTMNGLPSSPVTDVNGFYTDAVSSGFSGTVTPVKTGYTFTPTQRAYSNVTSDQLNQNYAAAQLPSTLTISGNAGTNGAVMNGLPGNPVSDSNGNYTGTVNYGFSATVTPAKAGYTFSPVSRTYTNVTSNQTAQDYTATPSTTYIISGRATVSGLMDLAAPCVGYWKMNDNAANTTVIDSSGKGNNGTAQQNTSVLHTDSGNPPNLNGALTFNGTSDYVNIGNAIGTGAYTKVAWVKRTGGVQNNIISSSTWSHVLWAPSEQSFKLSAGHNSSLFLVQDSVAMQTNTWYFVAVTFDPNVASGRMVLYKNGTKVDDANNVPTQIAGTTYIGRFLTGYGFTGSIDNVLIFNRTLSQEEISYLYNSGNGTEAISQPNGLAGVTMNGLPSSPVTDVNGFYTDAVSSGFSGTVTPVKTGYTFTPTQRAYSNVTSDQLNQNYAAAQLPSTLTISGNAGTNGAVMNGLPGNPVSDSNGNYTGTVTSGFSGMVTPAKAGYTFSPVSRTYTNVTSNQTAQNYTATLLSTYTISGRVTADSNGLVDVQLRGLPGDPCTDANGFYTTIVGSGFSGTVIPTKTGYAFNPPTRSYSYVTIDQLNQDYEASQLGLPNDDFNDNRRGSMWRISVSDPNTMVIEDISRLNITSIGDNDLAAPCVGYWKMNDNAANTTVIDSSGKGNNGTAQQNTSSLHTGSGNPPNLNGALTFNGTSDYVNVGSAIGTGAYTKVAWVKRTGGVQNNIISSSTWSHVLWAPSEQSFKLSAGHNSSLFLVQDSVAMQTNTWYFVAVTFDPNVASGRMVLYKNGTKVDDANNVPTQIAGTTYIGRFLTGYGFTGSIDNVLIFNRALSQDEITYLYSNGAGTETIPSGGGYGTASYTANGWSFDVVQDFEVKADYHYSDQSTMDGRVMMVLEYNDGNYVELSAGFDGSQAYLYYETVVDSNIVSSNEVARASNDGTLYVSYNAGLDELYLSFTGFGDANEWQTVTGLLAGQWSSDPVRVLIGGSSDGAAIRMGEAYLEDFKVDSGLILGWLPVSDIDGNGFIEWDDLKIMCDNWLDVGLDIPGNIFEDEDDIVNFLDFAEFGLAW